MLWSLADILGDEDKNVASKRAKMEKKSKENEEEFYASFVPKSDDMWEALEEEVDAIEKFKQIIFYNMTFNV